MNRKMPQPLFVITEGRNRSVTTPIKNGRNLSIATQPPVKISRPSPPPAPPAPPIAKKQ